MLFQLDCFSPETYDTYFDFEFVFTKQVVFVCTSVGTSGRFCHDVVARVKLWQNVHHVFMTLSDCNVSV